MSSQKEFKLVFRVDYSYTDYELQKRVSKQDFVKDVSSLVTYFQELEKDFIVTDAFNYNCRADLSIKIKVVFIPERKYVSLFE